MRPLENCRLGLNLYLITASIELHISAYDVFQKRVGHENTNNAYFTYNEQCHQYIKLYPLIKSVGLFGLLKLLHRGILQVSGLLLHRKMYPLKIPVFLTESGNNILTPGIIS